MKKPSYHIKKSLMLIITLLLIVIAVQAQDLSSIGFEQDVNDEVAAPINGLLWLLMIAGGSLGISKLKKK
tara:strand:+ start:105 stop:314 length:210 start_codon:yes stop_codon:yes gene_type:complete